MSDVLQKDIELSREEKRARLEHLLREKAAKAKTVPASFAQRRLWFLDQLEGGSAYNLARATRVKGQLNIVALRKALNALVARHESLRTSFGSVEGEPVQIIAPFRELELPIVDLRT